MRLPLAGRPDEPAPASNRPRADESPVAARPLEGVRVLVVEDEADGRELLRTMLQQLGAVVTTAACATEALDALRRSAPDVLLSDIEMPGMDGYRLMERVRALPPADGGGVPSAALTAYARAEDRTAALEAGFQLHLAKPVQPDELAAVVSSLFHRGRR